MYEPFFGMERRPFSATPDPGCFFSSSDLQAVLEELTACVERGQGIGILTAAAGMGKTLLCQRLAASLRQRDESVSQFECVYLGNSNFPTRRSLLQAILFEMGDEYSRRDEPELRIDLRSRLLSLRPQREALVLIVDEAHLFADEMLEELRTLSDLADEGSSLVRIVLSGQLELEERLTDRSFDALNQRISKHVFAESLTISESADYIRYRLEWAGCDVESVFTEEAVSVITRASGGVPRCLNQLSDHSLLLAFASDQKPVIEDTVREALEDLKQLPLHWNDVSDGTEVVGYVEGEDDEVAEDFSEVADDSSIDADREAALLKLASEHSAENSVDAGAEPFVENGDCVGAEDSAVAESQSDESYEDSTEHEPVNVPVLDGGLEFDFSGEAESEEAVVHPEEQAGTTEFDDVDETIVQVLPPAAQETMLEVRPSSDDQTDDDGDNGISFKITSDGVELDDFGPPEETASQSVEASSDHEEAVAETGADSGVIEFSFSGEASGEDSSDDESAPEEQADFVEAEESSELELSELESAVDGNSEEQAERTASVAEITSALFGQDSVLPEHKCDSIMTEPAELQLEEPVTSDIDEQVSDESTEQADSSIVAAEDSAAGEIAEAEQETFHEEEPGEMNQIVKSEAGYEEELVYDPYAALQEPDGTGIVWDVVSFSKADQATEVSETSEDGGVFAEESEVVSDHSCEAQITQDGICETVESSEAVDESAFVEEATAEAVEQDAPGAESVEEISETDFAGGLIQDEDAQEVALAEEVVPAFGIAAEEISPSENADEPACETDQSTDESAIDESTEDESVVTESAVVEQVGEEVGQGGADHVEEEEEETVAESFEAVFEEAVLASSEEDASAFAQDEQGQADDDQIAHDVVQPVEDRPLLPDRLVDAVLPLLDELDEDLDTVKSSTVADRSVLDIEAELIETIDHNSDELEDQIGATMLDICLDTQSALQDSAAAIRNAEAAELENLNDTDGTIDELASGDLVDGERFDIVQPEPTRRDETAGYELESGFDRTTGSSEEKNPEPENARSVEKPFGKLFSELRRRKR